MQHRFPTPAEEIPSAEPDHERVCAHREHRAPDVRWLDGHPCAPRWDARLRPDLGVHGTDEDAHRRHVASAQTTARFHGIAHAELPFPRPDDLPVLPVHRRPIDAEPRVTGAVQPPQHRGGGLQQAQIGGHPPYPCRVGGVLRPAPRGTRRLHEPHRAVQGLGVPGVTRD